MRWGLIDPWIAVSLNPTGWSDRTKAVSMLLTLAHDSELQLVRCLPADLKEPREVTSRLRILRTHLIRYADAGGPEAELKERPTPEDLDAPWRRGLYESSDSAAAGANWRDPVILLCDFAERRKDWPREREVTIVAAGRVDCARVLVTLSELGTHELLRRNEDPWLLEQYADATRRSVEVRLPRPPSLDGQPMERWQDILNDIADWTCGIPDRRYFLPERGWNPLAVDETDWRRYRCFVLRTVHETRRGPKTGYVDREGRIWCWDRDHHTHWDVQLGDDDYINVWPDGRVKA